MHSLPNLYSSTACSVNPLPAIPPRDCKLSDSVAEEAMERLDCLGVADNKVRPPDVPFPSCPPPAQRDRTQCDTCQRCSVLCWS